MQNFGYARADDTATAVKSGADSTFLAGGTELLNWMRLSIAAPSRVLDITRISELRFIREIGAGISIGALSTLNEIGQDRAVLSNCPVLSQACFKAASAQLRNLPPLAAIFCRRRGVPTSAPKANYHGPATSACLARDARRVMARTGTMPSSAGATIAWRRTLPIPRLRLLHLTRRYT